MGGIVLANVVESLFCEARDHVAAWSLASRMHPASRKGALRESFRLASREISHSRSDSYFRSLMRCFRVNVGYEAAGVAAASSLSKSSALTLTFFSVVFCAWDVAFATFSDSST